MNVGGGVTSFDRMWWLPSVVAYCPLIMPLRVGAQTGQWVKQRVKRAPWAASRSRVGVIASGSP